MKRMLALLLSCLLLLVALPISAMAATPAFILTPDKATVMPGDTVKITVSMPESLGWQALDAAITGDTGLTPVKTNSQDIQYSENWTAAGSFSEFNLEEGLIAVINDEKISFAGDCFTVSFKVANNVTAGSKLGVRLAVKECVYNTVENNAVVSVTNVVPRGTVFETTLTVGGEVDENAPAFTLTPNKTEVQPGDTLRIAVAMQNNPGWQALDGKMTADAGLTPVKIDGEDILYSQEWEDAGNLAFYNLEEGLLAALNTDKFTHNGDHFYVDYKVADNATPGTKLKVAFTVKECLYNRIENGAVAESFDVISAGTTFETTVTVAQKPVATLSAVSVSKNPTKTTYYVGDKLDTAGLSLTATYSDNTTKELTSGFTVGNVDMTTAGTKQVTVTYEGKTATFPVTVKTPTIQLDKTTLTLTEGDTAKLTATVDPADVTVSWKSSDDKVLTVSNGDLTAKAAGTATVTASFTYGGKTYSKTCTVTVEAAYLLGDMDQNGEVAAADALIALQIATGKTQATDAQKVIGDVDGKDGVAANDALLILQYATKKIDSFPIEK